MKTPMEWALVLRENMSAEDEWNELDLLVVADLIRNVQADARAAFDAKETTDGK